MAEKITLTDNGKKVLAFMQAHDQVLVRKDMIDMTGIKQIDPVLRSLVRHGLIEQGAPVVRPLIVKGETKDKEFKTYQLTDAGRAYIA